VKGAHLCHCTPIGAWFVIAFGHRPTDYLKRCVLNQPPQDQRPRAVRGVRLSHLPRIVAAPAAAWYDGRPALKSVPVAPNAMMVDPGDLVARALTIIAEETQAWQVRQATPPRERSP
jgi:hypothetical protein